MKCPCKEGKCHLGVHFITPKKLEETIQELQKVQKRFFMGHGIKTNDPKEAADIFLHRDHEKIIALLLHYFPGKLGVYMVPPMFYAQIPEAVKPEEFNLPNYEDNVRGDIAENKAFHALKEYFSQNGDDVVIVHSHKFLAKSSPNEKDFIIFNLSKGNEYVLINNKSVCIYYMYK